MTTASLADLRDRLYEAYASQHGGGGDEAATLSFAARSIHQLAATAGFVSVPARSSPPVAHGLPSAARAMTGQVVSACYRIALAARTGTLRGHIVTLNLTCAARKGIRREMPSLAKSPIAPILGQRVPLRGPARMLFRSYARTCYQPGMCIERLTTKSGDFFDADLSSFLEWQLWAFGGYEEHFAELFRCLVSPGDRAVDVGANIGVHTVRLAKLVGAAGEVIAIEPDAGVAERTRSNLGLNHLANARVVNAAASDRAGHMRLYRPDPSDTNRARASLLRHPYLTGEAATVPVLTIDEICDGPVALIKIDVEGHEAAVLRGAAAAIAGHAPSVVFEYVPELLDEAAQAPFGWLAERGYELFGIRWIRRSVTGRGRLTLEHLPGPPAGGGDYLAVTRSRAARLTALIA